MRPLLAFTVFWLLPLALMLEEDSPLDCVPRRSVSYRSECCYLSHITLAYNVSTLVSPLIGKHLIISGCSVNQSYPFLGDNGHMFREEGVFNYSTMLLREDLDLLVLGAREAVYALDLNDISKKLASVRIPLLSRPVPLWSNGQ